MHFRVFSVHVYRAANLSYRRNRLASRLRLWYSRACMHSSPPTHLIVCREPLAAPDYRTAIRLLASECCRCVPQLCQPETLTAWALEREEEISTYLGRGIALPHARVEALQQPLLCVGRSPAGIPWPEEPARLIFFLCVPEHQPELYLHFVSRLLRWSTGAPTALLQGPAEALHAALAEVLLPASAKSTAAR